MASIRIENLSKVYKGGTIKAVDNVSLEIKDKEFVVLVGPSGCGKSTTLRMIAGLEEISSGKIWIGDRLVNDVPAKDRDIAMVFQNYALYPHMTVFENMAFGLKLRGYPKPEIEKRVHEAADILNIRPYLTRRPRQLSGGEQQRVAIARAISLNPKYLFCDEPNSGLDPITAILIDELIKELTEEYAMTTIVNTHDMNSVMEIGEKIVFISDGKKCWEGNKNEILISDCETLNDFVFANSLAKKIRFPDK